ncbi:MAG TPA: limonene-1,2-epoxide hydrolase family protein [Vicinamibacterales bacterium]|nr:limonene-1,2-epoxide hydrolase family protein [Vicinamibacterales bacterium]
MDRRNCGLDRRGFLAAGLGAAAAVAAAPSLQAAEPTALEQANIRIVTDFCAAWPSHDLDRIVAFFADTGSYRMTEAMEPSRGRDALIARLKMIINNVTQFEILDTWARGPMVINERIDRFTDFSLKSWHGVGVFLIKEGKIVEWYDYTIGSERS